MLRVKKMINKNYPVSGIYYFGSNVSKPSFPRRREFRQHTNPRKYRLPVFTGMTENMEQLLLLKFFPYKAIKKGRIDSIKYADIHLKNRWLENRLPPE